MRYRGVLDGAGRLVFHAGLQQACTFAQLQILMAVMVHADSEPARDRLRIAGGEADMEASARNTLSKPDFTPCIEPTRQDSQLACPRGVACRANPGADLAGLHHGLVPGCPAVPARHGPARCRQVRGKLEPCHPATLPPCRLPTDMTAAGVRSSS